MSDRFDVEFLEPGDSFEGGPIEQSYFISAVMGAGGEVEIEGNKVTIFSLPGKSLPEELKPSVEKPSEPEAKKSATPPADEDYPLVDMAAEEVVAEEPSKPKYSRKPKSTTPVKKVEE